MSQTIYIEDYSPKSFVVRGETTEYKEELKQLGGKWNSRLTDKQSGEKFGAWLFWSDKRLEIEGWLANGSTSSNTRNETRTETKRTSSLEEKIDRLTRMLESVCKHLDIEVPQPSPKMSKAKKSVPKTTQTSQTCVEDYVSDEEILPMKRLLKK